MLKCIFACICQQTTLPEFAKPEFSVVRQHEEFVWLHDRFEENEDYAGIVVSPLCLHVMSPVFILILVSIDGNKTTLAVNLLVHSYVAQIFYCYLVLWRQSRCPEMFFTDALNHKLKDKGCPIICQGRKGVTSFYAHHFSVSQLRGDDANLLSTAAYLAKHRSTLLLEPHKSYMSYLFSRD